MDINIADINIAQSGNKRYNIKVYKQPEVRSKMNLGLRRLAITILSFGLAFSLSFISPVFAQTWYRPFYQVPSPRPKVHKEQEERVKDAVEKKIEQRVTNQRVLTIEEPLKEIQERLKRAQGDHTKRESKNREINERNQHIQRLREVERQWNSQPKFSGSGYGWGGGYSASFTHRTQQMAQQLTQKRLLDSLQVRDRKDSDQAHRSLVRHLKYLLRYILKNQKILSKVRPSGEYAYLPKDQTEALTKVVEDIKKIAGNIKDVESLLNQVKAEQDKLKDRLQKEQADLKIQVAKAEAAGKKWDGVEKEIEKVEEGLKKITSTESSKPQARAKRALAEDASSNGLDEKIKKINEQLYKKAEHTVKAATKEKELREKVKSLGEEIKKKTDEINKEIKELKQKKEEVEAQSKNSAATSSSAPAAQAVAAAPSVQSSAVSTQPTVASGSSDTASASTQQTNTNPKK